MSAPTMSDGSPVSPRLDARMLADLREWRRRYPAATMHGITGDELDMLLRVVDERDALRRELCGDPEPGFPPVTLAAVATIAPAFSTAINAAAEREATEARERAVGYRCIELDLFSNERHECGGIANYHSAACRAANA